MCYAWIISFYGLYNVSPQYGFSSYEYVEYYTIYGELSYIKEAAGAEYEG